MKLLEAEITIPASPGHRDLLAHIQAAVETGLADGAIPVRFAITRTDEAQYQCYGFYTHPCVCRES